MGLNRIGDVRVAQGRLEEAAEAYGASRAIREHLAASDPSNAGWRGDLSVSHDKIGDVRVAQGRLEEAAEAYGAGLAIAERLAASDPSNAGWQRDRVVSYYKLATTLQRRRDPEASRWLRRCHETLRAMRDAGKYLDPPLRQLLAQLERAQ